MDFIHYSQTKDNYVDFSVFQIVLIFRKNTVIFPVLTVLLIQVNWMKGFPRRMYYYF